LEVLVTKSSATASSLFGRRERRARGREREGEREREREREGEGEEDEKRRGKRIFPAFSLTSNLLCKGIPKI
jgi:hypothetical protein